MRLPVIADTYRVALHYESTDHRQHAENVIHLRWVDPADHGEGVLDDLVSALNHATGASFGFFDVMSTSAACIGATATKLDGTSVTHVREFGPTYPGLSSGEYIPQVAMVVTLYTLIRGRSHRGRVYMPFCAESAVDEGLFNSDQVETTQLSWEDFNSQLDGSAHTTELVVASYKLRTADRVDVVKAQNVAGTQRRRQSRLR